MSQRENPELLSKELAAILSQVAGLVGTLDADQLRAWLKGRAQLVLMPTTAGVAPAYMDPLPISHEHDLDAADGVPADIAGFVGTHPVAGFHAFTADDDEFDAVLSAQFDRALDSSANTELLEESLQKKLHTTSSGNGFSTPLNNNFAALTATPLVSTLSTPSTGSASNTSKSFNSGEMRARLLEMKLDELRHIAEKLGLHSISGKNKKQLAEMIVRKRTLDGDVWSPRAVSSSLAGALMSCGSVEEAQQLIDDAKMSKERLRMLCEDLGIMLTDERKNVSQNRLQQRILEWVGWRLGDATMLAAMRAL